MSSWYQHGWSNPGWERIISAGGGGGTVTVDATGAGGSTPGNNTIFNYSGLTITSANAIVTFISLPSNQSVTSVTWDVAGANQAFTLIGSTTETSAAVSLQMWGLLSPSSTGNKIISISTSNVTVQANAISLTGVNTSSFSTAFANFTTVDNGSATSQALTVSSASGHIVIVSGVCSGGSSTFLTNANVYGQVTNVFPYNSSWTAGAATASITATGTAGSAIGLIGVDVT